MIPTPLEEVELAGRRLLLKREDSHELGAFKWRGALPTLEAYKRRGANTIITASTGNHGAATAWAAERLDMRAVVFASEGTSRTKLGQIEQLGAEIRLVGADFDEAKEAAERFAADAGVLFVDGMEQEQYEGYSAIADEILDQAPETPAAVVEQWERIKGAEQPIDRGDRAARRERALRAMFHRRRQKGGSRHRSSGARCSPVIRARARHALLRTLPLRLRHRPARRRHLPPRFLRRGR